MKNEYLQIRINEDLKDKARQLAEAEGKKLTEWVTDLIKKEVWKAEK